MTARNLTAGVASAITEGAVRPALLFEGVFDSGGSDTYLRFWSGVGDLSWDGHTWTGTGSLMAVSALEESSELRATGFSVSLSGMPSELISVALQGARQGRSGKVWLALFDASGALIADPYQLQAGKLDIMVTDNDGTKCTITAQYESNLIDLERPRERRYTREDQRIDHPDDQGFDYVPTLQEAVVVWGRS